jgi:hypothetical protein
MAARMPSTTSNKNLNAIIAARTTCIIMMVSCYFHKTPEKLQQKTHPLKAAFSAVNSNLS